MSEASNVARRTRRTSVDASLFVRIRPLCQRGSLMVTLYRNCSLAFDIPLWLLEKKWTTTQKERISLLFERYPDLKEAYSIVHSLRMIFSNTKATWISVYESMQKWYDKVKAFANDSFNTALTLYVTGKMKYSTILSTVQQIRLPSLSTQR